MFFLQIFLLCRSAYVDFPSQEALDFVIEQKDLLELRGRKISVVACTASDNAKGMFCCG